MPPAQARHAVASADDTFPAPHCVQAKLPDIGVTLPAGHGAQVVGGWTKVPGAQISQVPLAGTLPMAHPPVGAQYVVLYAYVLFPHGVHVVLSGVDILPVAHFVQFTVPFDGATVPAAHGAQ